METCLKKTLQFNIITIAGQQQQLHRLCTNCLFVCSFFGTHFFTVHLSDRCMFVCLFFQKKSEELQHSTPDRFFYQMSTQGLFVFVNIFLFGFHIFLSRFCSMYLCQFNKELITHGYSCFLASLCSKSRLGTVAGELTSNQQMTERLLLPWLPFALAGVTTKEMTAGLSRAEPLPWLPR